MELTGLEQILKEANGNEFCPICGTPFKPRSSRQKTCGAPDCKRLWHNQYMRERAKRLREEDIDLWRKYHREAVRKCRAKKRERIKRDAQLKQIEEGWEKQADFDDFITEHGHEYGKLSAEKVLAKVPKIDVTLGGKHDNVHGKDSRK